jgi:hypothetical protein
MAVARNVKMYIVEPLVVMSHIGWPVLVFELDELARPESDDGRPPVYGAHSIVIVE